MQIIFRILGVVILVWGVFSLPAQELHINGYVRNYTGVLLNGNNEYAIIQNTLDLKFEQSKDVVAFKLNPFIYQYPDQDMTFHLREAYVDLYFPSLDLRIGKQQIIWGKADGVFITDIVSPKDLSEFLLRDFDEIRMGVTGIKANYYSGNSTLEMVWLPMFTPTIYPQNNSIWAFRPRLPLPAVPVTIDHSHEAVAPTLGNSELFVRYSLMTSLADVELMAASTWDDDPTPHMVRQIDPDSHQVLGVTVFPEHHRLTMAGGSFSTTVGPAVLRGEGGYYQGKHFVSTDPHAFEGVVQKNYVHYLVGIDYSLWGWKFSGQFIQQIILDYTDDLIWDEYDNMMTFLARGDYLNETLHLEFFAYMGLNHQDALLRPKITYDIADGVSILLGANLFTGSEGLFGQFDQNDMVYFKLKYSF